MSDKMNVGTVVALAMAGTFQGDVVRLMLRGVMPETSAVDFSDAVEALAIADKLDVSVGEKLIAERTAMDQPTGKAASMFDTWGKISVGATEVSVSALCGTVERTIGVAPGETLIEAIDRHLADYDTAKTSTTSLRENPPRNPKTNEAYTLKGNSDTRMYRGLALGSSFSAADKAVARVRKLAALQRELTAKAESVAMAAKIGLTLAADKVEATASA